MTKVHLLGIPDFVKPEHGLFLPRHHFNVFFFFFLRRGGLRYLISFSNKVDIGCRHTYVCPDTHYASAYMFLCSQNGGGNGILSGFGF